MSWESSAQYYRLINQGVRDRLGPSHSSRLVLLSVDFAEVERLQHAGEWDELGDLLVDAGRRLEAAGAEAVLVCTNTVHRLADRLEASLTAPFLHIADPIGEALAAAGHRRVGLLGTAFTMEGAFLRDRLRDRHGLEVIVPDAADRALVHDVIYRELVAGRVEPASRRAYAEVIAKLADAGAEAVILGCTEIMLLVRPEDSALPLFDTTALHAAAAVDWALADP
jgi:aspartate racemase